MENYFNTYYKKSFPDGGTDPPSRVQSYPGFSTSSTKHSGLDSWTNFQGSSGFVNDFNQLCLPTASVARQRRRGRDIVEKFSDLSLDDDEDDKYFNQMKFRSRTDPGPQQPQIHHNIFQTRVTTNQISARSLARVVNVNKSSSPEVILTKKTAELGTRKRYKTILGVILWTLGIMTLIFLLQAQDDRGSVCWNGNGASPGMLMVTVSANVSEWDGIWKASFTVRSDNNLILYILLIGAVVGFLRQIFHK